jgi:feruloyl esterase
MQGAKGRLFPGYVVGGMTGPQGWVAWITGAMPGRSAAFAFGSNYFTNMVYQDKAWDFHTFQPDRDTAKSDDTYSRTLNATDPDMSKFRSRGGKLIIYHGWADPGIPALATVDYYKTIRQPESFVRLFLVPGMQHCGGGPGPNDFGQLASGASGDALHDVNAAIERWVEENTPPAQIVAKNGTRTRPLCPYPQIATYKGNGSTDDVANFTCK